MNERLGFWSPLGLLVAGLGLVVLVAWTVVKGPVLFSPGPLNAVASSQSLGGVSTHAQLAGDCGACHTAPWSSQTMADRCLDCHQEVAGEMSDHSGLHGGLLGGSSSPGCLGCHTEHKGADASLTVLDPASFPHEKTGYSLRGHERTPEGAKVGCSGCHPTDVVHFDVAVCSDCHTELDQSFMGQHTATFGAECLPCHDGVDRYGAGFDHSQVPFTLVGKHAEVPCAECHVQASTVDALQQTPQACYSCHAKDDEHKGDFGQDCGQCHSADDWANATFDHSKSKFPLTGAHADVDCDKCHVNGEFKGTAADCVSCHEEPGFHANAFGAQSTQCAVCHTTTAWTPAEFPLAHDAIPIDHGAEEQMPSCKTCHPTDVNTYSCYGCHEHSESRVQGEHEGLPAAELADCIRCHPGGRGGRATDVFRRTRPRRAARQEARQAALQGRVGKALGRRHAARQAARQEDSLIRTTTTSSRNSPSL